MGVGVLVGVGVVFSTGVGAKLGVEALDVKLGDSIERALM